MESVTPPEESFPLSDQIGQTAILVLIGVVILGGFAAASFQPANTIQVLGFSAMICVSLLSILQGQKAAVKVQQAKVAADSAAVKVEQAVAIQDKKMDSIAEVAKATHTLVNSNMGAQLKISAVALRRLAENTKNSDDIAAAVLAEKLLHEHESKQKIVDESSQKAPGIM